MSKKIFVLLVVLMSLSLIGIISVQAYYIKNSVDNEKERFTYNVKKSLSYVANTLEDEELDEYFERWQNLDIEKKADSVAVSRLFVYQQDNERKETVVYSQGILEENYKLSSSILDAGFESDSINFKRLTGESKFEIFSNSDLDKDIEQSPIKKIINIGPLVEQQLALLDKEFRQMLKRNPIHKRISEDEITSLLSKKLKENNINIDYEFNTYFL